MQRHVPRVAARPLLSHRFILITVLVEASPNLIPSTSGSPGGDACGEPDGNRVLMCQPTGSYRPASDADQRLALSGKQRESGINGSRCVTFVGVASFLNLITEYKPTMLKTLRGLTSSMRNAQVAQRSIQRHREILHAVYLASSSRSHIIRTTSLSHATRGQQPFRTTAILIPRQFTTGNTA